MPQHLPAPGVPRWEGRDGHTARVDPPWARQLWARRWGQLCSWGGQLCSCFGAAGGGGQLCSLGLWGSRPGQHEGSTWADHLAPPGSEKACKLQRSLRTRGGTTSEAEASVLTDKRETTKMPLGG